MGDNVTRAKYEKAVRQIARMRKQDAALARLEGKPKAAVKRARGSKSRAR